MNFKIFPVFIGAVFLCHSVIAQDDGLKKKASEKNTTKDAKKWGWSKGGFFSSTLSNTTFSNWAAGGTNNTAFLINGNIFAIKKDSNYTWENYLKASYGVIRNGFLDGHLKIFLGNNCMFQIFWLKVLDTFL